MNSDAMPTAQWTAQENKAFEMSLSLVPETHHYRWEIISEKFPGKSVNDMVNHYQLLVHDLAQIEAGRVIIPSYSDEETKLPNPCLESEKQVSVEKINRRGSPWTTDEHERFLRGLITYGKGDWRSIARKAVRTRSATQVASHAQKHFLHVLSKSRTRKKRKSIHDRRVEDIIAENLDITNNLVQ